MVILTLLSLLGILWMVTRGPKGLFWALGTILVMTIGLVLQLSDVAFYAFDMLSFDLFTSLMMGSVVLFSGLTLLLVSTDPARSSDRGALVLFATVGAIVTLASTHLLMTFLGIEMLSIPLYLLCASRSDRLDSQEAGIKYLLLGAVASSVLLFGIALFFTGNGGNLAALTLLGALLMMVGLAFKVGLVPFHVAIPDVYEGAPTPVTAFMITVTKLAIFAALVHLLIGVNLPNLFWQGFMVVSVASILIGNLVARRQSCVKRLLAYSGIGHAGVMALSLMGNLGPFTPFVLWVYATTYGLGSLGVLVVVQALENAGVDGVTLTSLRGLSVRSRFLTLVLGVSLLSLAGIPIFPGFFGKFLVLLSLLNAHQIVPVILALVGFVIGVSYYFNLGYTATTASEGDNALLPVSGALVWAGTLILVLQFLLIIGIPFVLLSR